MNPDELAVKLSDVGANLDGIADLREYNKDAEEYKKGVDFALSLIENTKGGNLDEKIQGLQARELEQPGDVLINQAIIEAKVAKHIAAYGEDSVRGGAFEDDAEEYWDGIYHLTTPGSSKEEYLPVEYAPKTSAQGVYNELRVKVNEIAGRVRQFTDGDLPLLAERQAEKGFLLTDIAEQIKSLSMLADSSEGDAAHRNIFTGIPTAAGVEDVLKNLEGIQWPEGSTQEMTIDLLRDYMEK